MFAVRSTSSFLRLNPPAVVVHLLSPKRSIVRRMASSSSLPRLPIFEAIARHDPESAAVVHSVSGRRFTYGELLGDVAEAKDKLVKGAGGKPMDGQRVAFLVENSYDYVGA